MPAVPCILTLTPYRSWHWNSFIHSESTMLLEFAKHLFIVLLSQDLSQLLSLLSSNYCRGQLKCKMFEDKRNKLDSDTIFIMVFGISIFNIFVSIYSLSSEFWKFYTIINCDLHPSLKFRFAKLNSRSGLWADLNTQFSILLEKKRPK